MHEILSAISDDVIVKTVVYACAARGALHFLVIFSRISLFLVREVNEEFRAFRHELDEWRKFFRGP